MNFQHFILVLSVFLRIPVIWSFVLVSLSLLHFHPACHNPLDYVNKFTLTKSLSSVHAAPKRQQDQPSTIHFHSIQILFPMSSLSVSLLYSHFCSPVFSLNYSCFIKCHVSLGDKEATLLHASAGCVQTKMTEAQCGSRADLERSNVIGHDHDAHLLFIWWFMGRRSSSQICALCDWLVGDGNGHLSHTVGVLALTVLTDTLCMTKLLQF